MTDYVATGAQRDIHPLKPGIPYDEWLMKTIFPKRAEPTPYYQKVPKKVK